MKRIYSLITVIVTLICFSVGVAADDTSFVPVERQLPRLVDDAGLLSESEYSELLTLLDSISENRQCDVAVVTVNSTDGYTAEQYADDIYDYYGFGYGDNDDGMLLLLDMGDRAWHITTYGFGITALTDYRIGVIGDDIVPYLSDGDYYKAFKTFAEDCDYYIESARDDSSGGHDDVSFSISYMPPQFIITAIVGGFVIALIATGIMRSKLKTVRGKSTADPYVVKDSFKLTNSSDVFLYKNTSRTAKPKDDDRSGGGGSSTHTSSSGRSHGGGGGHF